MKDNQLYLARMMAATAMSQSLNLILRRNYLREDVWQRGVASIVSPSLPASRIPPIMKLVENVGVTEANSSERFQQVIRALHNPGQLNLTLLLQSDGSNCKLYIGTQSYGLDTDGSELDAMSNLLSTSIPGSTFSETISSRNVLIDNTLNYMSCITGVPRIPSYNFDFLGSFIAGMRGRPFAYIISAMPVNPVEVDSIIFICREMQGQAESLSKMSLSASEQESFTKGWQKSVSESQGKNSRSPGFGLALAGLGFAAGAIAFPPAAAALGLTLSSNAAVLAPMGMSGLFASFTPSTTSTIGETKTDSESYTNGTTTSTSISYVNKHVEAMAATLGEWAQRLEIARSHGLWKTQACILTQSKEDQLISGLLAKSLLNGQEKEFEPVRVHDLNMHWESLSKHLQKLLLPTLRLAQPQSHPLGALFCELATPMNTEELSTLLQMPSHSVPGINVVEAPEEASQSVKKPTDTSIKLGYQLYAGSLTKNIYPIDIKELSKHALVSGITRSGKTTTCKKILGELRDWKTNEKNEDNQGPIPFMVVEPAKDEYIQWATEENDNLIAEYDGNTKKAVDDQRYINIYMPGRKEWNGRALRQFAINPFDFVWLDTSKEPKILEHADRLKTIVNASLPMQEVLPVLMEELIYRVYQVPICRKDGVFLKWLPETSNDDIPGYDAKRPTFTQMLFHIDRVIADKGYDSQISGNLKAALTTRISSFRRGWRNDILNQERPDCDFWSNLFDRPTVINLTALTSDDDKAFFMSMLFLFLYEYRHAQQEQKNGQAGDSQGLKHLFVLEEAHRILANNQNQGVFSANPKAKVSEMFSNMISEIGAYEQGVMIVDQVPGKLNLDAIKNTNLKVVHKLVAKDDRQAMATCLNLKPSLEKLIGDLKQGHVLIRADEDSEAFFIKVIKRN